MQWRTCRSLCFVSYIHPENPPSAAPFDSYAIVCLKFLTKVVSCNAYQLSKARISSVTFGTSSTAKLNQVTPEAVAEGNSARASFFTDEACTHLLRFLLKSCLPLGKAELEDWQDDAEEYVLSETAETVDESRRAAATDLLLALVEFKPALLTLLARMLKAQEASLAASGITPEVGCCFACVLFPSLICVAGSCWPTRVTPATPLACVPCRVTLSVLPRVCNPQAVLALEALYLATGIVAFSMHDHIDFATWCRTQLLSLVTVRALREKREARSLKREPLAWRGRSLFFSPCWFSPCWCVELQTAPTASALPMRVLLRRVVWLITCWRGSLPETDHALKAAIYKAFCGCIRHSDLVLALAASSSLAEMLLDWRCGDPPFSFALVDRTLCLLFSSLFVFTCAHCACACPVSLAKRSNPKLQTRWRRRSRCLPSWKPTRVAMTC